MNKNYYDIKIEKTIITNLINLEESKRYSYFSQLKECYFYNEIGNIAYKEILKMPNIDALVLTSKLRRRLKITISIITEWLFDENINVKGLESQINELRELYFKRKIYELSLNLQEALEKGFKTNKIYQSIDKTQYEIYNNLEIDDGTMLSAKREFDKNKNRKYLYFDLPELDKITGGLSAGRVTVVGGGTGVGKSYFVMDFTLKQVLADYNCLFFSTELIKEEGYRRFVLLYQDLCDEANFDIAADKLKTLDNLKFYSELRTEEEIVLEINKQNARKKVDLVVIDHIQDLVIPDRMSEYEFLRSFCSRIKDIAINLPTALILVSQINRQSSRDKKIQFGYSGTGKIEQIAHLAIDLHSEDDFMIYAQVKKNRSGKKGIVNLKSEPPSFVFKEIK